MSRLLRPRPPSPGRAAFAAAPGLARRDDGAPAAAERSGAELLTATNLFELVGGEQWFADLVERFYDGVEDDPVLRPLYPDDLTSSRTWLAGFLCQYWGGPSTYSAERGHPRLRMRHARFRIGPPEREAWLSHMTAAVRAGGLPADAEAEMLAYFEQAALHLTNAP